MKCLTQPAKLCGKPASAAIRSASPCGKRENAKKPITFVRPFPIPKRLLSAVVIGKPRRTRFLARPTPRPYANPAASLGILAVAVACTAQVHARRSAAKPPLALAARRFGCLSAARRKSAAPSSCVNPVCEPAATRSAAWCPKPRLAATRSAVWCLCNALALAATKCATWYPRPRPATTKSAAWCPKPRLAATRSAAWCPSNV